MSNITHTEFEDKSEAKIVYINTCRICLKPGEIPIFGDDEKPDVSAEVIIFGDVDISYDDELPQHMCTICHELLQGAILFRNTAKESEILIKSNNIFIEDKNLDVDKEDSILETRDSDNYMSDSSESGNLKIADCASFDTKTSGFEKRLHDDDEDPEMIMIVISDDEESVKETKVKNHIKYSCETCKVNFQTSDDYCQHTKTMEHKNNMKQSQNLECNVCDKFIGKDIYVSHMIKHSVAPIIAIAPGKYKCKLCKMVLLSKQDSKIHIDCEIHKMSIRDAHTIECPVCHKSVRKLDLKLHIKSHFSELIQVKKKKCTIYNKCFDSAYYKNHSKRIHNKECKNELIQMDTETNVKTKSKDTFICDKCGKVFSRYCNFKLHLQTHGGELKYKCMFCPYRGLHQGLLRIHVRTHTGDYNYRCDQCPARFITKSNLNKHKRTHLGPINFKCTTCGKGFYTKLSLERHNAVDHLGIRNHVCNICGKAFGYRNNMMCHQLKVHKREKLTQGKGRLPNYIVAEIDEKNK